MNIFSVIIFILFIPLIIHSRDIQFFDLELKKNNLNHKFSSNCLNCHKDISVLDQFHNFECTLCHNGNSKSDIKDSAHKGIIKNPSATEHQEEKCGKCHSDDIKRVRNSLMSTANGIINTTRYLWGEQSSPDALFSTIKTEYTEKIPDNSTVDDFLRKVCLRCHLNSSGSKREGDLRSSGCSACHILYKNSGEHLHQFTKKIPVVQCLHCHNFNRVGVDYVGYFEHDYSNSYRSPIYKGGTPPKIYGIDQHRLQMDIHFEKGMDCIDCHNIKQIMGDGRNISFKYQVEKIECFSCHASGKEIITKVSGKRLKSPKYNEKRISHEKHKTLECYSCHSIWGAQDYGLNVIREDYEGYFKWMNLKDINIPDTQHILHNSLGNYGELYKLDSNKENFSGNMLPPESTDYIDNKLAKGVWYIGWLFRRWEEPILGINTRGKISPVRPDYQFYLSWVDENFNIKIDNDKKIFNWNPYVPHTTSKYGRGCYSCHNNLKTLGLGFGMIADNGSIENIFEPEKDNLKIDFPIEKITDISGNKLQDFIYPTASPLPKEIIQKLIRGSQY